MPRRSLVKCVACGYEWWYENRYPVECPECGQRNPMYYPGDNVGIAKLEARIKELKEKKEQ